MTIDNPYHEGELAVQQRVNETQTADKNSRIITDRLSEKASLFIKQQPMAIIGSLDRDGRVWASALFGEPGFLRTSEDRTLVLDLSQSRTDAADPLWRNLEDSPNVGLLVIDLTSRRRLRVNGRARRLSESSYAIDVERAYPNCPKYIQRRQWQIPAAGTAGTVAVGRCGEALTQTQRNLIAGADTFFVASAHPKHGVDASHRGGRSGFVRVLDEQHLRIPDYVGNSMFNTLGNFISYPRAGLVFIDFENSRILQLTGRAEILWELDDPAEETGGTRRFWQFEIEAWRNSILPFRLDWEFLDYSPFIPTQAAQTGAPDR